MALPTTVNQALNDALRATSEDKAVTLTSVLLLIKQRCNNIVGEVPMKGRRLSQIHNSLFEHKAFIQSHNLVTLGSRTVLANTDPQYADAAAVAVDIQAANSAFIQLTVEIETVLAIFRAANTIVDNDPTTGQVIEPDIPEADMTALRAFAASVEATLG